jgi:hypothetical protein
MQTKDLGWAHLTDLEKSTLSLITVSGRSKKEASIILNIPYYKFTEHFSRARKFFILFKEYYDKYGSIALPKGLAVKPDHRIFIPLLIRERLKPSEAAAKVPELIALNNYRAKDQFWQELFESADPENQHHEDYLNMLRDFDRWNSFRILPQRFRKSSPFLRRKNLPYKRALEKLISYTEIQWELVLKRWYSSSPPFYYIPVVFPNQGYSKVEKVTKTSKSLKYLSDNTILAFESPEAPTKLSQVVLDYKSVKKPSPYLSHKFWAETRILFTEAVNFKEVLGVNKEDYLDLTLKDRDFVSKSKATKSKKIRISLSRSEAFWGTR